MCGAQFLAVFVLLMKKSQKSEIKMTEKELQKFSSIRFQYFINHYSVHFFLDRHEGFQDRGLAFSPPKEKS